MIECSFVCLFLFVLFCCFLNIFAPYVRAVPHFVFLLCLSYLIVYRKVYVNYLNVY